MPLLQIPLAISAEYFPMINDMTRMGVIQLVIQLMFYFSNPLENPFWSPMFLQTVVFMLVGVLAYWLIFRHVVTVVPSMDKDADTAESSGANDVGLVHLPTDSF